MEKTTLTPRQHEELSTRIFGILVQLGPAETTMDLLAKRLGISKRTLYEIYGSKDDMLKMLMNGAHKRYSEDIEKIVRSTDNIMEMLVGIFLYHQAAMVKLSAKFFIDMDTKYRHLRCDYELHSRKWSAYIEKTIKAGVRQGVLREDVNYDVTVTLMRVQMESLKRMEEFFPPEITLIEAYNAIALGTLRSIATPLGMETLDKLSQKFT